MKKTITKQEMLENIIACVRPKREDNAVAIDWMGDLQVYFRIIIDDGTAIVTKELLDNIGVSKEWLLCIATDNLLYESSIKPMSEIFPTPDGLPSVLVATTKRGEYGAGIMTVLRDMMDVSDMWIIPSSVHEVLLIDKSTMDEDDLCTMITAINMSEVDAKDRLSDHPYDGAVLEGVNVA